jgi:hypothetical protein
MGEELTCKKGGRYRKCLLSTLLAYCLALFALAGPPYSNGCSLRSRQFIRSPDLDTRLHLSSTSPLVMKLYKQAIEDGTLLAQRSHCRNISKSIATAESSTTIYCNNST